MQAAHAAIAFQHAFPELAQQWFTHSNYLCFLSAPSAEALAALMHRAREQDILHSAFHEPDLNHALTAVAIEPSPLSRKLLKRLPLLGSEVHHPKKTAPC